MTGQGFLRIPNAKNLYTKKQVDLSVEQESWTVFFTLNTGLFGFKTLMYAAVGLYDTHSLNGFFLSTKIVKQFVFLVQNIVFIHMFLNL